MHRDGRPGPCARLVGFTSDVDQRREPIGQRLIADGAVVLRQRVTPENEHRDPNDSRVHQGVNPDRDDHLSLTPGQLLNRGRRGQLGAVIHYRHCRLIHVAGERTTQRLGSRLIGIKGACLIE